MIILPAIDLLDGACVRLYQGEYSSAHRVAADAAETAQAFCRAGAEYLHMVDLNGAKSGAGSAVNRKAVSAVVSACAIPVELGGGIRTMSDIESAVDAGVSRVIIGSAATDLDFLSRAVSRFGKKIAVGIDARNGFVARSGWTEETRLPYLEFARCVAQAGVDTIIFTDIARDGMLTGPNLPMLQELQKAVSVSITASGGIKDIGDIQALLPLGLYGAICGKSIYSGSLDLAEAIALTKKGPD